jgi:peptidyl-prolyl cis-trans isomerase A (cyclophilin A)
MRAHSIRGSALALALGLAAVDAVADLYPSPVAVIETTMGTISIELYDAQRPVTVTNFVRYVNEGFYDGDDGLGATIFHRVVHDFVIQGGGHTADLSHKTTHDPIPLENDAQLHNVRGTVGMARYSDPDSATSQFFINTVDNSDWLDWGSPTYPGYAVFGVVIAGMDVVDAIAQVPVHDENGFNDVPIADIVITNAYIVPEPAAAWGLLALALAARFRAPCGRVRRLT